MRILYGLGGIVGFFFLCIVHNSGSALLWVNEFSQAEALDQQEQAPLAMQWV